MEKQRAKRTIIVRVYRERGPGSKREENEQIDEGRRNKQRDNER